MNILDEYLNCLNEADPLTTLGVVVSATIIANTIIKAAHEIYKIKKLNLKERCGKKISKKKQEECRKEAEKEALKEEIKTLKSKTNYCKKSKNPQKCNRKIKEKTEKLLKKLKKMEQ